MLKILSSQQLATVDSETIIKQQIQGIQLMQRAALALYHNMLPHIDKQRPILILCGKGNNGGDALLVSGMLNEQKLSTRVVIFGSEGLGSEDFELAKKQAVEQGQLNVLETNQPEDIEPCEQVIDGLFGYGLNRPIEGVYSELINRVNSWKSRVFSIDVPSGCPVYPDFEITTAIVANHTFTFQLPKLTFLLPEYGHFVGDWTVIDIQLDTDEIENQQADCSYFEPIDTQNLHQKRNKFTHKKEYGHVLIFAGSIGMTGACFLTSKAALRSGCGLLTVLCPPFCEPIIQTSLPEAMTICTAKGHHGLELRDLLKYNSMGVGPGLGVLIETKAMVLDLLKRFDGPVVLDADGINLIQGQDHKELFSEIRRYKTVLTPHAGEFDRLFGIHHTTFERIQTAQLLCRTHKIIVVLKGRYSAVINEKGKVSFNSSGNAAMAKGGSGDVLTGMITAMAGKGGDLADAVRLAVFLHGKAGDLAAEGLFEESVIATDIIEQIPLAWRDTFTVTT